MRGTGHAGQPRRRDHALDAAPLSILFEVLKLILSEIASTRSWDAWLAATCEHLAELKQLLPPFVGHSFAYDEKQDIRQRLGCALATGMRMLCSSASGSRGRRRRLLEGPSHGCPAMKCIELLVDWFSYISLQVADELHLRFIAYFTSPSMLKLSGVIDCRRGWKPVFLLVHVNT